MGMLSMIWLDLRFKIIFFMFKEKVKSKVKMPSLSHAQVVATPVPVLLRSPISDNNAKQAGKSTPSVSGGLQERRPSEENTDNTRKHLSIAIHLKYHSDPRDVYNSILRQIFESKH